MFYNFVHESNKWFSINHQEVARYVITKYTLSAVDDNIFQYNAGIWEYLSKQWLQKLILDALNEIVVDLSYKVKTFDINEVLNFIVAMSYNERLKFAINNPIEYEINFLDNILNINTMKSKSYSPSCNKLYKLDVGYFDAISSISPHRFMAFLSEILEGYKEKEAIIDFLQEYIWYLLVPMTKYEKGLFLLWSWANGKSVLLNVIKWILWIKNISSIWLQDLSREQSRFNLLWKIALIDSDLQQAVQLDSWIIKKIISWETIDGKPLYRQILEFKPLCRIVCASNHRPYIKSVDNSINRRFVFIHLKKNFVWRENPNLTEELLGEKTAIIWWALKWLERLMNRKKFHIPKELTDIIDQFVEEHDSVKQFISDLWDISESSNDKTSYQKIHNTYKSFCKQTWQKPVSMVTMNKKLRDFGYEEYRTESERWFVWIDLVKKYKMTGWQNDSLFQNNFTDEW